MMSLTIKRRASNECYGCLITETTSRMVHVYSYTLHPPKLHHFVSVSINMFSVEVNYQYVSRIEYEMSI